MALCPNCGASLLITASTCKRCKAEFGDGAAWRPVPQSTPEQDELANLKRKIATDTGEGTPGNKATWVIVSFIAVTAAVYAIFLLGSAPRQNPPSQHWDAGFAAFGIPFVFLALAVWVARPWSVAYVISYITLIVGLGGILPFVLSGYFEGEKIILLFIPLIALWGGSLLALIASPFQRRA